jgi:hypothetical protein
MAQAYTQGIPEVSPTLDTPAQYQSTRGADAEAFGAGIAQAGEKLGEGMMTSARFFGKVAADDASNQFQDFASKLMHGDPSKMVPGPDGTQVPDSGYLSTKGRTALDQRPAVQKAIDDKIKELRGTLQTPEQQLEFDNFSKRYRTGVTERVGNHADKESGSWYTSVNVATAKLAMDQISNNYDKPELVAAGAADLTNAYVKNAQIKGGSELEIRQAMNDARRDALGAQLDAMAVTEPMRAMRVLEKNRDIAGVKYDEMAAKYRHRADQQMGITVGTEAIKRTYTAKPEKTVYTDVQLSTAGAPYGISGSYLSRVHALEGDGVSSTGAKGPFQFIDSTAKQYGVADPFNPDQAAAGAAKLAADNRAQLGRNLGRMPTDAELYLAHQQGAGGAGALLQNPNMTAQQALMTLPKYANDPTGAARAIRVNGGDPNAPAAAFTSLWTAKFNGAPGMAVAQRKASALQTVLEDPELAKNPQAQAQAISFVNQQMAAQKIAMEEDAASKKQASDQIQADLTRKIIAGGNPNIIADITNSGLSASEMQNLYRFATDRGGIQDDLQYGPGYTQAFSAILSTPDDPQHISSVSAIIARGGPGGDLTKKGVAELVGVMEKINKPGKEPDQSGIQKVKAAQLKYYLGQFSPEPEFKGMPRNNKGLDKYNREFIPAFEAAYRDWIKNPNNDPMKFLSDTKQMDAIMNRVYPPDARRTDMLFSQGGTAATPTPAVPPPPAPEGVKKEAWDRFMAAPPHKPDGSAWSAENWGKAIERLRADPSDAMQAAFDKKFAPSGYTAKDILSRLPAQKRAEAPVAEGPGALRRAATVIAAPFVPKGEMVENPVGVGIRG